mmetsp:Transcript_38603/g.91287  ORF Transcript_38603/g.91287 Transcript_38603/m.91287 type:complete len:134 (+) Transcript_38603:56-457(+)|eukprot:CAMPEP_0180228324 /NCGR_PEP_ID=MMETSP0987-20121128/24703_1 /TAXON_ID=697907 /ORGANISM="non described non described, Strain CCMP2293" /LENGTH=133 /DNA_ID=CAMNT_0022192511 /DNA_START=56 /DNA_END=457 /DNA_ORIENTATION=-
MPTTVAAHSDPAPCTTSARTACYISPCKTPPHAAHSKAFLDDSLASVSSCLCNLDDFFEDEGGADLEIDDLNVFASPSAVCGEDAEERVQIHAEIRDKFHGKPTDGHLVRLSMLRRSSFEEMPPSPTERLAQS